MATIEQLQAIAIDKVGSEALASEITKLLTQYNEEEDKDFFLSTNASFIDKFHQMVSQKFPEAIVTKQPPEKASSTKKGKEGKAGKKTNPSKTDEDTSILEVLKEMEPQLEQCRKVIREHNRKKREAAPKKPKKSRYTLLKERLLALYTLVPDALKKDADTYRETEKILLSTHRQLVTAWGMSKVKAAPGEEAIKEKSDVLEEKAKASKQDNKKH